MVDNLPVEIFINLNNGDLVEIYSSNDLLPNQVSKKKIQLFQKKFGIKSVTYKKNKIICSL